jgi:uncharacterized membrane protein YGL010W
MLSDTARHRLMVATPLLFALLLCVLHPLGGTSFYDMIADNEARFIAMHVAGLVLFPAMEIVVWQLLRDVPGRAARVARFALVPFAIFYTAWEVVVGIATWVLVHAGQPPAAVDALTSSPLVGEMGLFSVVGSLGWITALIGAAVAFRAAGAPRFTVALIAAGSLMAIHPPPVGPIALVALAAGIHRLERRAAPVAAVAPVPVG